jgi:DNA-binding transcriptional LysR family regulator
LQEAQGGKIALSALEGQPLIVMEPGTNLRSLTDRLLAESGVVGQVSLELDNVEAIKKMVEARLGLALLPEVAVQEEAQAGRLLLLHLANAPGASRQIALVYRRDKYLFGGMRLFMEMLKRGMEKTTA